jgi:hypothetical protein
MQRSGSNSLETVRGQDGRCVEIKEGPLFFLLLFSNEGKAQVYCAASLYRRMNADWIYEKEESMNLKCCDYERFPLMRNERYSLEQKKNTLNE